MDSALLAPLVVTARDPSVSLHERHRAFGEIVGASQHFAVSVALAALHDPDDAKDAAQDAFTTAWHRLHQLRDRHAHEVILCRLASQPRVPGSWADR